MAKTVSGSVLFQPFRAIGYVIDSNPFALQALGTEHFVIVSIGKSFQMYNCAKLTLTFMSPQLPRKIRAVASHKQLVFTAIGAQIVAWKRVSTVRTYNGHDAAVHLMLPIGDLLISVAEDNVMHAFMIDSGDIFSTITFPSNFPVSCVMHPSTYLNKIVVGSNQGGLQLWNIKSKKLIHTFQNVKTNGVAVRCIEQSPVVDVVAIGLADGRIILHNIKLDITLFEFKQADGGITSLSFRSDGTATLVSGSECGTLVVWDLENKRIHSTIPDAHHLAVTGVQFLAKQPVMITSGADNSLKMWIFDQGDGTARLLKSRSGHSAAPTKVRFYGDNGHNLLSAGQDRAFRFFSLIQQQQNRELSQGHLAKKARLMQLKESDLRLSPITDFATCAIRERDWSNVITCHAGDEKAYTWSFERFALGKHVLKCPVPSAIRCVEISACGNFGILGLDSGRVEKFNMQSGFHRLTFGGVNSDEGHTGAVYGVAVDGLNRVMISGSYDGTLKFWEFYSGKLIATETVGSPVVQMLLHRDNGLLAVATDDLNVRIYDSHTRRLVRIFRGHTNRITDMAFSPDGRWLVTSSMDATVAVWDLPSGRMVDWIATKKAITGLSFSPTGDYLATSHVNNVGIYLWSNKTLFSSVFVNSTPKHPVFMKLPTVSGIEDVSEDGSRSLPSLPKLAVDNDINVEEELQLMQSPEQVDPSFKTLSDVPKAKWLPLLNLELIRERNKPIEPAKAPEKAPFFLPTTKSANPMFVPAVNDAATKEEDNMPVSRIVSMKHLRPQTTMTRLLNEGRRNPEAFDKLTQHLKSLSPSAIDLEFRQLGPLVGGGLDELEYGLDFFIHQLQTNRNFELIQAYMHCFLKVHGDTLVTDPAMVSKMNRLKGIQQNTWRKLESSFLNNLCLVSYFSNIQM